MRFFRVKTILFLFSILIASFTFANDKASRFPKDNLQFYIQENDGSVTKCDHELLTHVPWWKLKCADREYTADVWIETQHNFERKLSKVTLMFHAKEGVRSSGEKLVQFKSHFTSIIVDNLANIKSLSSSLDVRNGLASLVVNAKVP
jgi:hypothetical protein